MINEEPQGEAERARSVREEAEHLEALARARRARVARVTLALGVGVVLMLFILWNAQPVKVNFVFVTRHPPLIWVMLACAVLGGLIGYVVGRPGKQVRLRRDGDKEPVPPEGGAPAPPEAGAS